MTVLAKERHFLDQHAGLGAAMRVMAIRAIVPDRLVFPQIWAALFRMALVAGLVDRVLGQVTARPTVRVVAVRTHDLAFPDGMPGKTVHLRPLVGMAVKTDIGLCGLDQDRIFRQMNGMTVGTGNVRYFMLAAAPVHAQPGFMAA